MISRKNPTTVGGRTIGRDSSPSIKNLHFFIGYTSLANSIPKKNVNTVETVAVFSDIHSGE
jgi:hypothetical protein